jgi:SAM-dependent methyltransferase
METLTNADELKKIVKEKYTQVATGTTEENACCGTSCGCSTGTDADISMAEDYSKLKGYDAGADLGLGCGLPTEFALIREGDVVLDLGSGAGNDAFVARSATGPTGKVIGVDMTEKMIERARKNVERLKYNNVEFRLGDIEQLPVNDDSVDVVVSNCVLNLVPNKEKAFSETFRVLKPGGHFSVSDIVLEGDLPGALRSSAEMYAGCISGAMQKEEYLRIVKETGFANITVQKEKRIGIPDEVLNVYLNDREKQEYKSGKIGIYSITVYAEKPVSPGAAPSKKESEATWWDPGCCN